MKRKFLCLLIICLSILMVGIISYGAEITKVNDVPTKEDYINRKAQENEEIYKPTSKEELGSVPSILNLNEPTDIYIVGYLDFDMAYQVLDIVNQERQSKGLNTLQMDASLLNSAMHRAAETSIYFEHTRPNGTDCFTMDKKMYAENIAAGQTSAQMVMESWMLSDGHRENILDSSMKSIGIGCFYFQGIYYWTQCFGIDNATTIQKPQSGWGRATIEVVTEYIAVAVDKVEATLKVGETTNVNLYNYNIEFPIQGSGIEEDSATWTSSDTKVAKVDEYGKITAVGVGEATITVKISDAEATIKIQVDLPFTDVSRSNWYYNSVEYCYKNGIIYGTTETKYSPNTNVTRGNLVTILWRIEGSPKVSGNLSFPDVKESDYYYEAVKWAQKSGVVHGYDTGKFGPNNNITREQLATICSSRSN